LGKDGGLNKCDEKCIALLSGKGPKVELPKKGGGKKREASEGGVKT